MMKFWASAIGLFSILISDPAAGAPSLVSIWNTPSFQPVGIEVSTDGKVFVSDVTDRRIYRLTLDGTQEIEFGGAYPGPGQLTWGGEPALTNDGTIVAVNDTHLKEFTLDGAFIRVIGLGPPLWMQRVFAVASFGQSGLIACDSGNHRLVIFDAQREVVATWGAHGPGPGQFSYPTGVCVDGLGFVYVADTGNKRIQKIDSSGQTVLMWNLQNGGGGQLSEPACIACDPSRGIIYVSNESQCRIEAFDGEGGFLFQFGSEGSEPGQFSQPRGVAVDANGLVYVADTGNARVQVFSQSVPVVPATWSWLKTISGRP